VLSQRNFDVGFCLLKAAGVNGNRELLTSAIPAVIIEPELTLDAPPFRGGELKQPPFVAPT